ncbi:MAG TPA: PIN domain-containing protein [Sphingomicrobium sp.]|nr:PIN domain-containing protein [Sphingomicrobium sp.]
MSFLLDTNVISEGAKPRPDPAVRDWLASVDEDQLFLSIISLAELRHGVERLEAGRRKSALDLLLSEDLPARFEGRLLVIDLTTADHWGRIVARADNAGRPIGAMDAFLAAAAEQHRLTLVTPNISDFEETGVRLFNPWNQGM